MQNNFKRKAGAIVLNPQDLNKILLIYRAKQKDWSFPKGHIEPKEDLFSAVKRELLEETGTSMIILANLDNLEYRDSKGNNVIVYMYLGIATEINKLKPEYRGDCLEWVSLDEIEKKLTHKNLRDYFLRIKQTIKEY